MSDLMFWSRVQHILETAIGGLSADDVRERVDYCRRTGEHGIRMHPDEQGVTFTWGGRTLAVVDRDLFDPDAYFEPIRAEFMPDAPDDPRELTGE